MNVIYLFSFRLCHTIAKRYLELLRHDSFTCSIPEQYGQILPNDNPNSIVNYNWNHPDNVLHMQIGLSCCPSPNESDLSKVWSRHRSSLIDLFSSLQGIHVIVENLDHRFTDGEDDAFVYIREIDLKLCFKNGVGHVWHLVPNGTYTVEVTVPGLDKPMIKYMVPVQVAEFTEVFFLLPSNQMMPKFFVIFTMACFSMVMLFCVVILCRCCARGEYGSNTKWLNHIDQHGSIRGSKGRGSKSHNRPSYDGFQLLTRGGGKSKTLFEESESEDDMLDKSMKQYGLKMPPTKIYRDEFSSQSSEDELPTHDQNSFLHNRHNNRVQGVDIIGNSRKLSEEEKWQSQPSQETILNM